MANSLVEKRIEALQRMCFKEGLKSDREPSKDEFDLFGINGQNKVQLCERLRATIDRLASSPELEAALWAINLLDDDTLAKSTREGRRRFLLGLLYPMGSGMEQQIEILKREYIGFHAIASAYDEIWKREIATETIRAHLGLGMNEYIEQDLGSTLHLAEQKPSDSPFSPMSPAYQLSK